MGGRGDHDGYIGENRPPTVMMCIHQAYQGTPYDPEKAEEICRLILMRQLLDGMIDGSWAWGAKNLSACHELPASQL